MQIEFLGAYGGCTDSNNLTSFLVDGCLAIDAGCLTQTLSLKRQTQLTDILISHSHLDHTLSLPFLADNLFGMKTQPLRIWSTPGVIQALRTHIFNEDIWPDFSLLPSVEEPTIRFCPFEPETCNQIGDFEVTPIRVNHAVPCTGFLITRDNSSIIFTSDTCSTDRIWEVANECNNLKAVIVDCSFPNSMEDLGVTSGHNTPGLLARDLAKLKQNCRVLVYHLKPQFQDLMIKELKALNDPRLEWNIQSSTMEF